MTERLVLRGGTVVDGSRSPEKMADVVVEGDRIAAVIPTGEPVPDAVEYDARGLYVLPGFIDVHSHDDLAVVREPWLLPKLTQGVTTVVVGNCGHGVAPVGIAHPACDGVGPAVLGELPARGEWKTFADYLAAVEAANPAVNVAALAAHNALRLAACGLESRPATADELATMAELADAAREAGALGLSTGLGYQPAAAADTDEIVHVASRFADRVYATHLRDESDGVAEAIDEALVLGRRSGCRVHISHLKCAGERNWGRMPELLDQLTDAGATADVYPYTAASTALRPALGAVGAAALIPERYIIATAPGHEDLEGRSLADLAESWGCTGGEAADRVLSMTDDTATVVYFTMSETDVATALAAQHIMIGSDGLAIGGRSHPRLYGTFPRVLSRHVAGEPHLSFEDAVWRMTGLAAETFGLRGRGRIAPGASADLVVVDRATLADRATYDSPRERAAGIRGVMVNGVWALDGDDQTGTRAGRVLRHDDGRRIS
jgi:N-acyl-D-amino-acid deacylase